MWVWGIVQGLLVKKEELHHPPFLVPPLPRMLLLLQLPLPPPQLPLLYPGWVEMAECPAAAAASRA